MKRCGITGIKLFIIIVSIAFSMTSEVYAQKNDSITGKSYQIELRLNYDFFVHHHFNMRGYDSRFNSYEISFQKATFGQQYWESFFNYPTIGFTLFYSNLANIQAIGSAYAVYPFINYTLNRSKIKSLNLRFGVGLGYLTKTFDRTKNHTNSSIGSHFNAAISITLEYRRLIAKRFNAAIYTGIMHFSNGATRAPNNGLNIINTGISIAYSLQEPNAYIPKQKPTGEHPFRTWKNNMYYYLTFTYSAKDLDKYIGYQKHWSVYNLSVNVLKQISYISRIGLGLDFVYDETDKTELENDSIICTDSQILRSSINVAYELVMNQTSFLFNIGFHVTGKELGDGRFYQKFGLKQNVTRHTFLSIALTTHFARADFIGFGFGLKLK